ncbi:MAG: tyrosine-type recombinase/integrase [Candidatus Wallbacteria bacterium]
MGSFIRKRTTKKGVTWQIVVEAGYDEKGQRKQIFKSITGTKKEAEKIMAKIIQDVNGNRYVNDNKITVAQFLREWIKVHVEPQLSPTSADGYKVNIERHIIPEIGHITLQQLKHIDIQNMYARLLNTGRCDHKGGLAPRTIKYIHRNLSTALEYAIKMQLISNNPAKFATPPKIKAYRSEIYDENEITTMLSKAKGTDLEVPLAIAVTLGLRRGELLALKWQDIDFENVKVTIKNNLVKTTKGCIFKDLKTESSYRSIDIPYGLIKLLKEHKNNQEKIKINFQNCYNDNDLVCCHANGNPFSPCYFTCKFEKFLIKNHLKKIRLHDLRHTNATLMLKYGIPAKIASKRLGHSSVGITLDLYSHVIGDMQREAAQKIDEGVFGKLSEPQYEPKKI